MAEHNLPDQLNEQIDRLLAGAPAAAPERDPLLQIAADLLAMPRPEFKTRLREELERRANMSAAAVVNPVPKGYRTVTPYLIHKRGAEMIEFVKQAFGAEETFRTVGSAGGIHAELRIGNSMVMMGGGLAYQGPDYPAAIHYYVDNVDEVYETALRAGATSVRPPADQPYGERLGWVRDAFSNQWYIAKRLGATPENQQNLIIHFHPVGAPKFIEFVQQAFGGELLERYDMGGAVLHAKVRIGDSIIELGEPSAEMESEPVTSYLYVPHVDEVYRKALAAGASSIAEPTDHPYGDRGAGVKDAWGHTWYIATHIKDVAP